MGLGPLALGGMGMGMGMMAGATGIIRKLLHRAAPLLVWGGEGGV